jgi:hypothetical protein
MTKIPSTEKTEDFIYRFEIKKGAPLHDPGNPHFLVFEQFIGPTGIFHSMDVSVFRNMRRANDIEFRSFEHRGDTNLTFVKCTFHDNAHHVTDHDYLLTVILRYLQKD